MYNIFEILKYNNLEDINIDEDAKGTYWLELPYRSTKDLKALNSFVSDLYNNEYYVDTDIEKGKAKVKAFRKSDINLSSITAPYYTVKKWADKLNRKLKELEVVLEKIEGDTDYTKRYQNTRSFERGRYGGSTVVYIINPEINMEELKEIYDFFSSYDTGIDSKWFNPNRAKSVARNPYLKSLGYSDNETYLDFMINRAKTQFDPTVNLGR